MGLLAAIGSAAASALGPLISTAGQLYTNSQNVKQQDYWNERAIELANSAHQRERVDLEAAGLNPILAANSGSATPSLSAATLQNPTSSFGQSARQLQNALTGQTRAEVEQAKADASSAKAYADRAEELVATDVSAARARNEVAHNEARVSEIESHADRIDALARLEALQGHRPPEVDDRVSKDETYKNLVNQYKNEIRSGSYRASLGRAVFRDVLDGSSSASQIYHNVKGRQPGKVRP